MRGSPTCFRSRSTAVFYRSKLSFDSKAQYLIGFCGPHSLARSVAWKKLPGTSRKRRRAAFPPPVFIGWSTIVAGTRAFIQNNRYRAAVTGRWGRPPPQKFATGRCLYKLLLLLYGLRKRSLFFFFHSIRNLIPIVRVWFVDTSFHIHVEFPFPFFYFLERFGRRYIRFGGCAE